MKKLHIKLGIVLIVISMLFSMVGCGQTVVEESVWVDGDGTTQNITHSSGSSESDKNAENGSGVSSSNNTNSDKNTSTAIDYEALKGTTVKVLMWRDLTKQEKTTIANFESKYSMKVTVDYANFDTYLTKLASLVATGDAPDVGVIAMFADRQGCFPIGATKIYQPASVTKQNFNDGFWDLDGMNQFKIKDQYFAMIAYNNWYDCRTVLMYNADMFKVDGITTPYELWKAGKWNWTTFRETAEALKKKGHPYALELNTNNNLMLSAGTDFVTYDGKTFKSTITDSKTINAWTFNANMVKDGLQPVYGTKTGVFTKGEAGMIATNLWAFRKDGFLNSCDFEVMGVPYPSPKGQEFIAGLGSNLFAVPKGAKNPIGSGVFLRYFLDSANNGDFAKNTINPKLEEVFDYLTKPGIKTVASYSSGVIGYSQLEAYKSLVNKLGTVTPDNVTTTLQASKQVVDKTVDSINQKLK